VLASTRESATLYGVYLSDWESLASVVSDWCRFPFRDSRLSTNCPRQERKSPISLSSSQSVIYRLPQHSFTLDRGLCGRDFWSIINTIVNIICLYKLLSALWIIIIRTLREMYKCAGSSSTLICFDMQNHILRTLINKCYTAMKNIIMHNKQARACT